MKIVVTGANGFVGKALCESLVKQGHQVTAMTRQPCEISGTFNWVVSNYTDSTLATKLHGHDCVIHLASKTHTKTKATKRNLALYRSANVEPSIALATAVVSAKIPRFIYLSTIKVNGEQTYDKPFSYTDAPAPQDAYGITKWETEQALQAKFVATHTDWVIIRCPLVWSATGLKGNLATLEKWINMGIPLPFKNWNNKRDLISLNNLCNFLSLCTDHPGVANQVLLISDGQPLNILEIATLISKKTPRAFRIPQLFYERLANSKIFRKLYGNLEIDISRSCSITSWKPTKTY